MEMKTKKHYLLNYLFLSGILLLVVNDHYLKWTYSNWLTGKISDFAGLLVLPFFLSYLFPKRILPNVVGTGLFFIFWKSPFSQGAIEVYNEIAPIQIVRTVDYSDLTALVILPFSYFFIRHLDRSTFWHFHHFRPHPNWLLLPVLLVFMATSPPRSYYWYHSTENVKGFQGDINIKMGREAFLNHLQAKGVEVYSDTIPEAQASRFEHYWEDQKHEGRLPFYRIDQWIIDRDTLRDLQFALKEISERETTFFFNGLRFPGPIPNNRVMYALRKYYYRLLKNYFQNKAETKFTTSALPAASWDRHAFAFPPRRPVCGTAYDGSVPFRVPVGRNPALRPAPPAPG